MAGPAETCGFYSKKMGSHSWFLAQGMRCPNLANFLKNIILVAEGQGRGWRPVQARAAAAWTTEVAMEMEKPTHSSLGLEQLGV